MSDTDGIRNAIAQILADGDEAPHLVGDVTLIAELTSQEGETYLFTVSSTEISVWKERGMLMHRLDTLAALSVIHQIEEDD